MTSYMGHAHHTQRSSAMAAAAAAVAAARGGPCPGLLFEIEWIITISLRIFLETRQLKTMVEMVETVKMVGRI